MSLYQITSEMQSILDAVLDGGIDSPEALLAEIEAAQVEIYLESYIFADDEVVFAYLKATEGGDFRDGLFVQGGIGE